MNTQQMTGAEAVIYKATIKFWISQGMSQDQAELAGWEKVESVRQLKKQKGIIRF